MSKIIIIEGLDRVGKDTQVALIIKRLKDKVFHKLHYSALPFNDDTELHTSYSKQLYEDMFKLMLSAKENNINLIFNRAHLGETIYSPLYRGYSGDYVFDIEKEYVNRLRENLYLITIVNDPHIVWSREDGQSLSKNEEDIKAEVDGFQRAHRLSKIKNKLMLNVGTMSADDVSNIIIDFLSYDNFITGEDKQLNMFK
jgi:thymidylate kinase